MKRWQWIVIAIIVGAIVMMKGVKVKASSSVVAKVEPYRTLASKYGDAYGVSVNLILAHVCVESAGNPAALSSAGAIGLMQMEPTTLPDINQMLGSSYGPNDLYNPETAIRCGTAYLNWLFTFFSGDSNKVIRAYNQGSGNIQKDATLGQDYYDKVEAYFNLINGEQTT